VYKQDSIKTESMKHIKYIVLSIVTLLTLQLSAQEDWSSIDFTKKYKAKNNIKKKLKKSLHEGKPFINKYMISQATVMRGSQKSSALQSGSPKTIYTTVSLTGLKKNDYQKMVDDLYLEFKNGLEASGIELMDGENLMKLSSVQKKLQKNKKTHHIGYVGDNTTISGKKGLADGSIPGYPQFAVMRDLSFLPGNSYTFYTDGKFGDALFAKQLVEKDDVDIVSIIFKVSFVSFEGSRGYKRIQLSANPILSVKAHILINGYPSGLNYEENIMASNNWIESIEKMKDEYGNDEFFDSKKHIDGEILRANSDKYIQELTAILSNFQKDIIKQLTTLK
jgi:hypothetical protein